MTAIESATLGDATRDRIFLAAERLFATRGFADVSVRDITTEAGVNLAAVNYHFGSKDALLFEIFTTRSAEVNRARARMLHEAASRPCAAFLKPLSRRPCAGATATATALSRCSF